ncbi:MAG TPA: hypothetical protein VH134_12735 [Candidatus Dormibacteraeota bacterium]|nr:hypothetical protein [Candidatus Dormibacteraeota bacterium]
MAGDGAHQLEAIRVCGDDLAGLAADRAGRAEEDDTATFAGEDVGLLQDVAP